MTDKLTRAVKETGRVVSELNERIDQLIKERDYARELVWDCFNQACQVRPPNHEDGIQYDHMCLSTYEEAQEMLIMWGHVKPEECARYKPPCPGHEWVPSEEFYGTKVPDGHPPSGMENCLKCRALRLAEWKKKEIDEKKEASKHKEDSEDPPITS